MDNNQTRLDKLEQQISDLTNIVNQLNETLILLPDVQRYGTLKKFLVQGDFKKADQETTRIMLDILGENRDSLTPDDAAKFPCNCLQVIDQIWQKYSQQRFGFSVQLKNYYQVGGNIDTIRSQDINVMRKFASKIGWLNEKNKAKFDEYDNWDFSLSAPMGCFPAHWWKSPYGLKMVTFFFARLMDCNL